ncbi:MAG: hypothetical protein SH857_05910 [Chitinophagales bacterium]|mgnify:CR=1 FL=1|nr:hypothetical protein [Chitinophagales bacterium]
MGIKKFLTPKWVDRYADIYRQEGFKGVIKKGGWKLVVAFFLFYLIRDSILYLLIPFLIARGLWDGCN